MSPGRSPGVSSFVVLLVGRTHVAVPVSTVMETMRPLPIEPIHEAPSCVLGLAIVRGRPLPVIDANALVGALASSAEDDDTRAERFVVLRIEGRSAVLLVDGVLGLRTIADASLDALPSLATAGDSGHVASIGVLDGALLLVLGATRLLPVVDALARDTNTRAASRDRTDAETDASEPSP